MEDLKTLPDGEQKFNDMSEIVSDWNAYNNFMKAKNLGIKFGPDDLTRQEVLIFHEFQVATEKIDQGGQRNGKRQIKNNF